MGCIQMQDIRKHYTLATGERVEVLKSIDLTIEAGEFVAVMGPSGSGKSTLMNLFGTLDKPSSGSYILDGEQIATSDDTTLAGIRNRKIGFVFQGFNLLPQRTVLDNVALPLLYRNIPREDRKRHAEHYLEQVGLASYGERLPNQLSGGQQQRVAIARALAGQPRIILADEPTGNLDSHTGKEIMQLFKTLNEEGITIILVTHDEGVARSGQRLVHLKDGEIIYDGPMY